MGVGEGRENVGEEGSWRMWGGGWTEVGDHMQREAYELALKVFLWRAGWYMEPWNLGMHRGAGLIWNTPCISFSTSHFLRINRPSHLTASETIVGNNHFPKLLQVPLFSRRGC